MDSSLNIRIEVGILDCPDKGARSRIVMVQQKNEKGQLKYES